MNRAIQKNHQRTQVLVAYGFYLNIFTVNTAD